MVGIQVALLVIALLLVRIVYSTLTVLAHGDVLLVGVTGGLGLVLEDGIGIGLGVGLSDARVVVEQLTGSDVALFSGNLVTGIPVHHDSLVFLEVFPILSATLNYSLSSCL